MNIKNYTSTVPVERTVARIEQILAKAGASGISKDFADGQLTALHFTVAFGDQTVAIRLPIDAQAVFLLLLLASAGQRRRPETEIRLRAQAQRTAWKLMQDWVEVQLSLINMHQADFVQVFMPYVWDGKQTFYQRVKDQHHQLLLGQPST